MSISQSSKSVLYWITGCAFTISMSSSMVFSVEPMSYLMSSMVSLSNTMTAGSWTDLIRWCGSASFSTMVMMMFLSLILRALLFKEEKGWVRKWTRKTDWRGGNLLMFFQGFTELHVGHNIATEKDEISPNDRLGINLPHGITHTHAALRNDGVHADRGVRLSPL